MANLTRSNIAYDLNISPHKLEVSYADEVLTYVFSSELYRQKFNDKIESHRAKISESLTNRFGFTIENNKLADLKLYTTIEKRGFLIYKGQVKVECLSSITLDGNHLITQS